MSYRKVIEQVKARASSDGDGVKLLRIFGGAQPERFDPFLLMDEFGSDEASDYIGGFPSHPHRGFQTITYMLEGKMEHRDHMENVGLLKDGDVQWMTAGRGVIHSEMPKQTEGKMRGFQVWLNLPAAKKMQDANYSDVPGNTIPLYDMDGVKIKAIAGATKVNERVIKGHFDVEDTQALYLDMHLDAGAQAHIALNDTHNALVYTYEGDLVLGDEQTPAARRVINRFDAKGDILIANNGEKQARVIVLAGIPLKEKIVQYGPFVMNSTEEIDQALQDYRAGRLTA